ncbi:MAG: 2,3-butanediol dehydrogenase [Candidatus Abyssubacteria bacterium]
MKAALLIEQRTMVIDNVPEPPPPSQNEVLLKVDSCGICGTDVEFYETGAYNPRQILGHECAATVAELGPGVTGLKVGDRVTVNDLFSCGECDFCRRGLESLCERAANLGIHWPGAFAEYTKAPARSVLKLPDSVSMQEAALVPTLAVGYHVVRRAHLTPDTKSLILGAGPVGLSVLAALKLGGAESVAVSDPNPISKRAALALGAQAVFDPEKDDVAALTESLFASQPRLVFECVGKPETILQSMDLVERGGTVVIVGNCFHEITLLPITWILKEINIHASQGTANEDLRTTLQWLAEKKFDPSLFITRTVSLDALPETMEEIATNKRDIKVIVKV